LIHTPKHPRGFGFICWGIPTPATLFFPNKHVLVFLVKPNTQQKKKHPTNQTNPPGGQRGRHFLTKTKKNERLFVQKRFKWGPRAGVVFVFSLAVYLKLFIWVGVFFEFFF